MYPTLTDEVSDAVTYNEFMHARLAFSARRGRRIGRGWWPVSAPGSSPSALSADGPASGPDSAVIFVN